MTSKVITSMEKTFLPEIDSSNKLDADGMQNYWKLIVILSWTTEFGRVDIFNELLILVQYEASSRVGHLEKVLHIFSSMKKKPKFITVDAPKKPSKGYGVFSANIYFKRTVSWCWGGAPIWNTGANRCAFVNHGLSRFVTCGKLRHLDITYRAHFFLNKAPVYWFNKRQDIVDSSAFTSEFISL